MFEFKSELVVLLKYEPGSKGSKTMHVLWFLPKLSMWHCDLKARYEVRTSHQDRDPDKIRDVSRSGYQRLQQPVSPEGIRSAKTTVRHSVVCDAGKE